MFVGKSLQLSTSTMQLYFAKAEQLWATDNYNTDVSKLLFSPSLLTFWKDNRISLGIQFTVFIAITKSVDQKVVYSNRSKKIANYFWLFLGK